MITSTSGAKIDIEKEVSRTLIRIQGKSSSRAAALVMINERLEIFGFEKAETIGAIDEETDRAWLPSVASAAHKSDLTDPEELEVDEKALYVKIPPGASPDLVARLKTAKLMSTLSASARRRVRRKETSQSFLSESVSSYNDEEVGSLQSDEFSTATIDSPGPKTNDAHLRSVSPATQSSHSSILTSSMRSPRFYPSTNGAETGKSSLLNFLLNDGPSLQGTSDKSSSSLESQDREKYCSSHDSLEGNEGTISQFSSPSATAPRFVSKSGISIRLT